PLVDEVLEQQIDFQCGLHPSFFTSRTYPASPNENTYDLYTTIRVSGTLYFRHMGVSETNKGGL
ncbi:MAG: hypothetical protein K0Q94_4701, partial [Paenibacillus sp.]|nr:hypothetical protein [Paenibacillus sp.]